MVSYQHNQAYGPNQSNLSSIWQRSLEQTLQRPSSTKSAEHVCPKSLSQRDQPCSQSEVWLELSNLWDKQCEAEFSAFCLWHPLWRPYWANIRWAKGGILRQRSANRSCWSGRPQPKSGLGHPWIVAGTGLLGQCLPVCINRKRRRFLRGLECERSILSSI